MTKHIIRRLIQAIPTLFGVTLLSYILIALAPGDPVAINGFGGAPARTTEAQEAQEERLRELYGLNDPWTVQYLRWLVGDDWMWWKNQHDENGELVERVSVRYGIVRGDFGFSQNRKGTLVTTMIGERFAATLELGIASLVVSLALGVPIGIIAAIRRGGFFDNISRVGAVVLNAVPSFFMGLVLLGIFSFSLGWLPSNNQCDKTKYSRTPCIEVPIYERLDHLVLPTLVLAFGGIAGFSRYMRTSMLDTVNSDYVRTAKAKGLTTRTIWFKHAARNALIPLATFLGPSIVGVLSGAVIIEQVFNWPGLGRLAIDAVNTRDYPVVMAFVLIGATLTIIGYIISDILYAVFDPRIRF